MPGAAISTYEIDLDAVRVELSKHAHVRVRQRGYRASDLDLVMRFGTTTATGAVLTRRDAEDAGRRLRDAARRLEHLVDAYVVVRGSTAITVVRATRSQRRKGTRHVA